MLTVTRNKPTYNSGIAKDGQPLNLLPASKKTFEQIIAFSSGFSGKSGTEQLYEVYKLFAVILNTNTASLTVTEEEISGIDPVTVAQIIREYCEFMRGFEKLPNSGSRTVPTTGTATGSGTTS